MDTVERAAATGAPVYDGFISYSHAADGLLAPRLQAALQRFAKPWWKRRAIRLFRDESSLSANPHLWAAITKALDESGWFVLLLSPDAAASPWVNQEIEYWKNRQDPTRILPVVTDGTFTWSDGDITGDAVPEALRGVFAEEPRWVDLRFAREEDQLDLKNPRFSAAVADIASALRGVPKDELESEEVKQHRRTIRTAWTAGVVVAGLAVAATGFAMQSTNNAHRAESEADRAEANAAAEAKARLESGRQAQLASARELAVSAVNVLEDDPELAILLTVEAMNRTPEGIDQPVELIKTLWEAVQKDRLAKVIDTGTGGPVRIALSADGSFLAASFEKDATLRLYSLPGFGELWFHTEETTDSFGQPFINPNGEMVAVGISNSTFELGPRLDNRPPDVPGRVVFLDRHDGSVIDTVEYQECAEANAVSWSPQGSYFAVAYSGPCPRLGASNGGFVEILDGETFDPVARVDTVERVPLAPTFDPAENLYVFGQGDGVGLYPAPEFEFSRIVDDVVGVGNISPDGSRAATTFGASSAIYDVASEWQQRDLLPFQSFSGALVAPVFSPDGSQVIIATPGTNTFIWDVESGEQVFQLRGGPGTSAAMSPDGVWLYTGHSDGTVKVWNLDSGGGLQSAGNLGNYGWINANSFAIGPEVGAAVAGDISAFDFRTVFFDKETGLIRGEPVAATSAVALADNRFALRSLEGVWIIYDPMSATQNYLAGCPVDQNGWVCTDTGNPAPATTVLASIDGTELAISVDDRSFTLVDPRTGTAIGPLAPLVLEVEVFARDWLLGFSKSAGSHVAIDRLTGEELARFSIPKLPSVSAFQRWEVSETGGTIAILDEVLSWSPPEEVTISILHTESWEADTVVLDLGRVRGFSVSPDGTKVALGDENGLHIVDVESASIEQSIPLPSVSDIHWLEADTVLIGTTTGIWAKVPLTMSGLIALAKGNLTRSFTGEECATYRIDPCPTLDEIRNS